MIPITVRRLQSGEEERVSRFIAEIFAAQIAPLYAEEGRLEFERFIAPEALRAREGSDRLCLAAVTGGEEPRLAGVVEVWCHVCLLFAPRPSQRRGIGRRLLEAAKEVNGISFVPMKLNLGFGLREGGAP